MLWGIRMRLPIWFSASTSDDALHQTADSVALITISLGSNDCRYVCLCVLCFEKCFKGKGGYTDHLYTFCIGRLNQKRSFEPVVCFDLVADYAAQSPHFLLFAHLSVVAAVVSSSALGVGHCNLCTVGLGYFIFSLIFSYFSSYDYAHARLHTQTPTSTH